MFAQTESNILFAIGFDLEVELPYKYIGEFCQAHVDPVCKDSLSRIANRYANDSFKLPLSLYYHPQSIAAACLHMAALYRKIHKLDIGFQLELGGQPWFKKVDPSLEQSLVFEIIRQLQALYKKDEAKD